MVKEIEIKKSIINDVIIDNPLIKEYDDYDFIRTVDYSVILDYSVEFSYGNGGVEKPIFKLDCLEIRYHIIEEVLIYERNIQIPDQWSADEYDQREILNLDEYTIEFYVENLERGFIPKSIEIDNNNKIIEIR